MSYAGALESTPSQIAVEKKELIDPKKPYSPFQLSLQARATAVKQQVRTHLVINGSRRLLEIAEVPLAELESTVGYAFDLTELEEVEAELKRHIDLHHEVLNQLSTPIGIFGSDTRLSFFNPAYQKLFAFDESWLHTKPTLGEVLEDLRSRQKLPEMRNFQEYKKDRLQLCNTLLEPIQELVHMPDGQILRMLLTPHPLGGIVYLFEDVTDKLALERRYNTLIAVQKETLDHLFEGVLVVGTDNRLRLYNPSFANIWALTELDLIPETHLSKIIEKMKPMFMNVEDWQQFQDHLTYVLMTRSPTNHKVILKDSRIIQYSYIPLPDGSHLISFNDVSDSSRFEQALSERNKALEYADKLKSDFISHVSYELRVPLNTIIGFIEILLNQYFGSLNERQIDYCKGIVGSSQKLLSLINDMIDLASIEAGKLSLSTNEIHLENFLSNLVGLVYNRAYDQSLEVLFDNQTSIDYFLADEKRLKQAIFNLLNNAIKFTPSNGCITLLATEHTQGLHKELCLSVKDTGVGISEEDQKRLFKIFETTPSQTSTGLGLSIVKSLIELHKGRIEIKSKIHEGTTIHCFIPLITPEKSHECHL
ncbi:MAG: PAS-domain containing protein [Proteobacteria bacterium]|nr:PAS-domain containing protein [Pseudomonadota bacterium]